MRLEIDASDIQPIVDKAVRDALQQYSAEIKSLITTAHGSRLKTTAQLAEVLGVCSRTVGNLVDRGDLVATRIGDSVRFSQTDIDAYLEACKNREVAAC